MKRSTFTHHKLADLADALNISEAEAVGTLGFLWHATGEYAPAGDIGRFTNSKIASLCHWRGSADALIDALLATGWIDQHSQHRLLIHDWPDHCEGVIHAKIARKRAFFANKSVPDLNNLRSDEREMARKWYEENTTKPRGRPSKGTKPPNKPSTGQSTGQTSDIQCARTGALPSPAQAMPSHALPSPGDAEPTEPGGLAAPGSGLGGSGATVADALGRVGVGSASIAVIAACPAVTIAEVKREWAAIVQANGTVRSRPGLLVARLCKAHGIQRAPPKGAGHVGLRLANERLRKLRETQDRGVA